jgi:hypothetical protein
MRPGFAPRYTHTVPVWRAVRQRRRSMVALRVVALAERYLRALEAAATVDAVRLREACTLLAAAKRVTQTPRQRLLAAVRPVAEGKPRTPGNAVALKRAARRGAAPRRDVDRMTEDARQDAASPLLHPAAIPRAGVRPAQRK